MKNTTTSVLGWDVPVSEFPETLTECVTAAGGEQKLVDQWTDYILYHKTNTAARSAIVEALENTLGVERVYEKVKSPTKTDPNRMIEKAGESEQTYKDRVVAQSGKSKTEIWDMIKDQVGTIAFQAQFEGRGGVGRLAKQDTNRAQILIDDPENKWQTAVQRLEALNPGLKIEIGDDGKPKIESLAAALRTNRKRIEDAENASLGIAA